MDQCIAFEIDVYSLFDTSTQQKPKMYHSPIHQNQFVLIISALVFSCGTASARPDAIDGAAPVKQVGYTI